MSWLFGSNSKIIKEDKDIINVFLDENLKEKEKIKTLAIFSKTTI